MFYPDFILSASPEIALYWLAAFSPKELKKKDWINVNVGEACNTLLDISNGRMIFGNGLSPRLSMRTTSHIFTGILTILHLQWNDLYNNIRNLIKTIDKMIDDDRRLRTNGTMLSDEDFKLMKTIVDKVINDEEDDMDLNSFLASPVPDATLVTMPEDPPNVPEEDIQGDFEPLEQSGDEKQQLEQMGFFENYEDFLIWQANQVPADGVQIPAPDQPQVPGDAVQIPLPDQPQIPMVGVQTPARDQPKVPMDGVQTPAPDQPEVPMDGVQTPAPDQPEVPMDGVQTPAPDQMDILPGTSTKRNGVVVPASPPSSSSSSYITTPKGTKKRKIPPVITSESDFSFDLPPHGDIPPLSPSIHVPPPPRGRGGRRRRPRPVRDFQIEMTGDEIRRNLQTAADTQMFQEAWEGRIQIPHRRDIGDWLNQPLQRPRFQFINAKSNHKRVCKVIDGGRQPEWPEPELAIEAPGTPSLSPREPEPIAIPPPGPEPIATPPRGPEPIATPPPGLEPIATPPPGPEPIATPPPGPEPIATPPPGLEPIATPPGLEPIATPPGLEPIATPPPGPEPIATPPPGLEPIATPPPGPAPIDQPDTVVELLPPDIVIQPSTPPQPSVDEEPRPLPSISSIRSQQVLSGMLSPTGHGNGDSSPTTGCRRTGSSPQSVTFTSESDFESLTKTERGTERHDLYNSVVAKMAEKNQRVVTFREMYPPKSTTKSVASMAFANFLVTGLADVLSEFFEVAFHNILFYRNLYPDASFQRKRKYKIPVQICFHPSVSEYVSDVVKAIRKLLLKKEVKKVSLTIINEDGKPLEQFYFNIDEMENDFITEFGTSRDLEMSFREICLKIKTLPSMLTNIPQNARFTIQVYAVKGVYERLVSSSNPDDLNFPWLREERSEIRWSSEEERKLVPIKVTDTLPLKMQFYVVEQLLPQYEIIAAR